MHMKQPHFPPHTSTLLIVRGSSEVGFISIILKTDTYTHTHKRHLHLCLQAAEEVVDMVLRDVPVQVSQVGVKLDKGVERDPRSTPLFIVCQDLTRKLQRTHEGLRKCVKKHREADSRVY